MNKFGLFVLLYFTLLSLASAQNQDAQIWSWLSVDKKITKKITGIIEQQVRLNHNLSFPKNIFTELGVAYRFNKTVKYTVCFRYMNRGQTEGGFINGNRIAGDLRVRYKKKPFMLSYRNRIQREYREDELVYRQINYVRNKLALSLDLDKKFTPYISFEIYYHLNNNEFNKNRYTIGVNFNLKNRNELDLFYRMQDEYNVNNPERAYIMGIGFSHSLRGRLIKKKKKKKKD